MRGAILVCVAAVVLAISPVARGDIGASVTYTATPVAGGLYQYNFTLTNTGTTNISTFWVGWTAAVFQNRGYIYDLLGGIPQVNNSPANWTGIPVADSQFGGYSAEWYGLGAGGVLAPGDSLSNFTMTISDTPAQMSGASIIGVPESTSWVYVGSFQSGGNLNDLGAAVSASPAPEPTGVALLAAIGILGVRRRNCHR